MKDMNNPIYTIPNCFLSFQEGNQESFNHFFELFYKPLLHFANAIVTDLDNAEDIVEEAFIKLWEKRETITSVSAIKPYLYKTVRNASIDTLRRRYHANEYKNYLQKLPVPLAEDIHQKIIVSESMHHVYLAVQNLPSKYKRIFHMLWVEGKEVKEIAQELNLPMSTVKSQKARTLELIRKQLPQLGSLMLMLICGIIS